jgi:hypothetical protein
MLSKRGRTISPSGVSCTMRFRQKSGPPSSLSSRRIATLIDGCVTPQSFAARVKLRSWQSARKHRI